MADTESARLPHGCWVDLFERPDFTGRFRRLPGPGIYAHFDESPADAARGAARGSPFGVTIASLAVGPGAYVQLYRARSPEKTSVWLSPGESIADLRQLKLTEPIDSLRVFERPPRKQDSGFASYVPDGRLAGGTRKPMASHEGAKGRRKTRRKKSR